GTLDYAAAATPATAAERIDIVLQGTLVAGTTLNNTATVTNLSPGGGTRAASASVNSVGGGGPPGGMQSIPTLSQWGLALLSLLVITVAGLRQRLRGPLR
ncbi:MAG: motif, partial [Rhodoferax sp.]|nr:motif [Rhodoferax sp.]